MAYLYVQIAVLVFACVFSLWILRETFEVDIGAKIKEFEQQIASMDIENERLEAEIATMQEKVPEYKRSLKTAEDQLGPAKENYDSKLMQKKAEEVSSLDKKNADCVETLPPLVEEKTELDTKITKIRPIIENLIKDRDTLKEQRDKLKLEEEKLKSEYLILFNEDEVWEKINADINFRSIKCNAK